MGMNKTLESSMVEALVELYGENDAARSFFDVVAHRKNDSAETSIDRMAAMSGFSRSETVELARRLNDIGAGNFVVGRKGAKSRFCWDYSLKSLGLAATGQSTKIEAIDEELLEDARDQVAHLPVNGVDQVLTIPEAKRLLAKSFGVTPESIEITIKG
jgi:hypothetical protein